MKLADWLAQPNADGSRKRRYKFAEEIGVSPTMVTEYAEGRMRPGGEVMDRITIATAGAVTAVDFQSDAARAVIAGAAQ